MTDYDKWLSRWEQETPTARAWFFRFCQYQKRIEELVKASPFPIIGVKYTGFDYNWQAFHEEPCLRWCFRNLAANDYAEVFVIDQGSDGIHIPVSPLECANAVMLVRAIMFQTEADAAWFKLACIDKVCDAYAWRKE